MRKFVLLSVAIFLAFVGCNKEENQKDAVMVILKGESSDYWSQVGTAIEAECRAEGVEAVIRYTANDADYRSQLDAMEEMEKLKYNFKGIVAVPIYSEGNHQVEAKIAEAAAGRNIPVIIIDTPVDEGTSPLAGKYRAYVGTDNGNAGKILAGHVAADKENILSVRSKASNASLLRYNGFSSVKGKTEIWETTEAEAVGIDKQLANHPSVTDIVYFNGSLPAYSSVLEYLGNNGKTVYTFDVFEITLYALMNGAVVKGILAQNTFEMGRQAVDAVFNTSAKNPIYIEPIYITKDNLTSEKVKPFIDYYFADINK